MSVHCVFAENEEKKKKKINEFQVVSDNNQEQGTYTNTLSG